MRNYGKLELSIVMTHELVLSVDLPGFPSPRPVRILRSVAKICHTV